MAKSLTDKGIAIESDASDSSLPARPIRSPETDAFVERLKELIGDRKIVWFAKECSLPESNIRTYLNGRLPSIDKAAAMANAGGVTLDWLSTGRLPKTRHELRRFLSSDDAKATLNDLPPLLAAKLGMAVGMSDILADIPAKDRQTYLVAAVELILDLTNGNPKLQERFTEDQETLEATIRIAKTIVAQRARDGLSAFDAMKPIKKTK